MNFIVAVLMKVLFPHAPAEAEAKAVGSSSSDFGEDWPYPSTLKPQTLNPQPSILNYPPSILHPQFSTLNPQFSSLKSSNPLAL
jgi:hypothetical protein